MAEHAQDLDFALALSLQEQFSRETTSEELNRVCQPSSSRDHRAPITQGLKEYDPKTVVDSSWELADPNPDIHNLFIQFDLMFFEGTLVSRGVVVSWSNRMTLCAGVCSYRGREGFCSIRLSGKLLNMRPRRDLVQTLLHEMIHAYLFVTHNNTDHDGHGPNFQTHMHRINHLTGAKITIYHSFHDEVRECRKHWWKCDGPCQRRAPFFGIVRRSMNRAPSCRDPWWAEHQKTCGGSYSKIKEPEGYKKKREKKIKEDKGNILNGEAKSKNKRGKQKSPPIIDLDKNKKIDEMFPKANAKDKVDLIHVGDDSESSLSDSSTNERRSKILAAVEKRLAQNENRGMKTEKRLLSHGSPRDIRQYGGPIKRRKLTISEGGPEKTQSSSPTLVVPEECKILDHSTTTTTPTVIDLCEDTYDRSPGPSQSSSTETTKTVVQSDDKSSQEVFVDRNGVVVIDELMIEGGLDDEVVVVDGVEFKTCPVCGMNTIPAVIINAHVAFCLEEEDWDDE